MAAIELGKRIQELLTGRGWSQGELARRIGVGRSHLSRLISGQRTWQPEQLERVAEALGLELPALVAGTDAEGLPAANENAHGVNRLLTDQLAEQATVNTTLRASLQAVEAERDSLRSECNALRTELLGRPRKQDYEALKNQRDEHRARIQQLERAVATSRQHATGLHARTTHLQATLQIARAQAARNYQAYVHWRQQAENNGKAFTGIALAAAGYGIVKLLSDDAPPPRKRLSRVGSPHRKKR